MAEFDEIDLQLGIVRQRLDTKRSLEVQEADMQGLLGDAKQSRYDMFQAIQWLQEKLEGQAHRKEKGKGSGRPNQIHAELFEAETNYKAVQADCNRLQSELTRIQDELKQFETADEDYARHIGEKRAMIVAQQDWAATQLLVMEAQLESMQETLDVLRDFGYSIVRQAFSEQASILGSIQPHIKYNSAGIKRLLQSVDKKLMARLEHYTRREKVLRDRIREFIEGAT